MNKIKFPTTGLESMEELKSYLHDVALECYKPDNDTTADAQFLGAEMGMFIQQVIEDAATDALIRDISDWQLNCELLRSPLLDNVFYLYKTSFVQAVMCCREKMRKDPQYIAFVERVKKKVNYEK